MTCALANPGTSDSSRRTPESVSPSSSSVTVRRASAPRLPSSSGATADPGSMCRFLSGNEPPALPAAPAGSAETLTTPPSLFR